MDTKDTDPIVDETTEAKKTPMKKASAAKSEKVTVEADQVEPIESQEETLHLPYYDNHAITALILSILSVVSPFLGFGLGGIVGLTLGIIALYQVRQAMKTFENSMTQTAKILAVIGIVVSVIVIGITITMCVSAAWHINAIYEPSRFTYRPQFTYYHRYF